MAAYARLEKLLTDVRTPLTLTFADGEVWELEGFVVAQDSDEEIPHCTAAVRSLVVVPPSKHRLFNPGAGVFFSLDEVHQVTRIDNVIVYPERPDTRNEYPWISR